MIGGQVADLTVTKNEFDLPVVDYINIHKTGKLIKACAVSGAIAADTSVEVHQRMHRFGEFLGLAFQSVDDLMDGDGYMRVLKARDLRQKVRDLIAQAKREIRPLGKRADKLQHLADFLLLRMPRKTHEAVSR